MTIRHILVPVLGTEGDGASVATAARLAKRFDAHITGLFQGLPTTPPGPPGGGYEFAGSTLYEQFFKELTEEYAARAEQFAAEARGRFDEAVAASGIDTAAGATWRSSADIVQALSGFSAGLYDLTALSAAAGTQDVGWRDVAEAALFGSRTPVLVAPKEPPETIGSRVYLAWNRSLQSWNALRGAMPFLTASEEVTVFSVATGAKQGASPEDVAQHLAWHGITARVQEIEPDYRDVGEALLEEAQSAGADLIAMGAFSHSRFREMLLGGVTRHVMAEATLPVLMVH